MTARFVPSLQEILYRLVGAASDASLTQPVSTKPGRFPVVVRPETRAFLEAQADYLGGSIAGVAGAILDGVAMATQGGTAALRGVRYYAAPDLLLVDEVGYLSYSNRHADLLFELISRRYEQKSTVLTTNRPFKEWHEVFPNAACVVSLVDRLVHRCEVIPIQGKSYRLKEAQERAAIKTALRSKSQAKEKSK